MTSLSLEQQFKIASFDRQTQDMNREQAIAMLADLYRQLLLQECKYKKLLEDSWGISDSPSKGRD